MTTRRVELVPHTKLMLITGWTAVAVHAFTFTTILVFIITRSF